MAPAVSTNRLPHPNDALQATAIELDLCVDNSATYPCGNPVTSTSTYVPQINLTYGQVLDGVVRVNALFGTITIFQNGVVFCTLPVDTGGSCPTDSVIFDSGVHVIVAQFHADTTYADSVSAPVTIGVMKDGVTTMLNSSLNPAPLGSQVAITAKAVGEFPAIPVGEVTFTDGAAFLQTIPLDATGTATLTTSTLSLRVHHIIASYSGALNFLPAADSALDETIVPPGTNTSLTSSLNPSAQGQNVTFTASVAAAVPGLHPSGAVGFADGSKVFATVLVSPAGLAYTDISTLASGTHNITANYSGDAATSPSLSPVLVQQVDYPLAEAPPGYKITVTPSPVTLGVGRTANLIVTVTPISGFSAPVTLTCTDLPNEAACTFGQSEIPAGGGSTTLDLSTMAPHDCGSSAPYFYGSAKNAPATTPLHGLLRHALPALALVMIVWLPRRRRSIPSVFALLALCAIATFTGCSSHCTDFGTYPGDYTFKVTGAATAPGTSATPAANPVIVTTSVALSVKL